LHRSQMKQKPTVFVVDDGPAVLESLRWLLEAVGLQVETYASPEEFLAQFDASKPGCILLDIKMPTMSGFDVQQELQARGSVTPVIFLTGHGNVPRAVQACKGGATDFLEKPFDDRVLLRAIQRALATDRLTRQQQREEVNFAERAALLTPRQRDVMTRVIAGKTSKEISAELGLSPRTVEIHRGHLMARLGIDSVAVLVRLAMGSPPAMADGSPHSPPRFSTPSPVEERVQRNRRVERQANKD